MERRHALAGRAGSAWNRGPKTSGVGRAGPAALEQPATIPVSRTLGVNLDEVRGILAAPRVRAPECADRASARRERAGGPDPGR